MELSFIGFGKVKGIVDTFITGVPDHPVIDPIFYGYFLLLLNKILFEEGLQTRGKKTASGSHTMLMGVI